MHPTGDQLPLSLMTPRETYLPDSLSLHRSIFQPQPLPSILQYINCNSFYFTAMLLTTSCSIYPFTISLGLSRILHYLIISSFTFQLYLCHCTTFFFHFPSFHPPWLALSLLLSFLSFQVWANAHFPLAKSLGKKTMLIIRKLTPFGKYARLWTANGNCRCWTADKMPKFTRHDQAEFSAALSNATNSP